MMMKITLFVVLALLSVLTKGDFSTYTNCAWMDKEHDFKLYWTLEQNQIKMAVSVKKLSSVSIFSFVFVFVFVCFVLLSFVCLHMYFNIINP